MTHPASCGVLMPECGADGVILVQHLGADGEEMRHFLMEAGAFHVPAGVSSIWVELIGGGATGGADGEYVAEALNVNPGDSIDFAVGRAGEPGIDAEDTTFGPFRARGGKAKRPPAEAPSVAAPQWVGTLG